MALDQLLSTSMPAVSSEDLEHWTQITRLLLTGSGSWRARITVTEGFPNPKNAPKELTETATNAIRRNQKSHL